LKVISLYGKNYKIKKEDLNGIDIILFDLQDAGARYFTYISTLKYAIETCAENNIELWILDRPNPVSPLKTDGPITAKGFTSFVSIAPIPILHGMTIGETGLYFNYLLDNEKKLKCRLSVIQIKNWDRKSFNPLFESKWVKPSPNMTSLETAIIYGGTCLIEGTNVSEGRGTQKPFLTIGAPFIKSSELIAELKKIKPAGLGFLPVQFTPVSIPGTVTSPKYENTLCSGIEIKITDRALVQPVKFGIELIYILHKLYPEFTFKDKTINNLFGNDYLRKMIISGEKPEKIISKWQKELNNFINLRSKFLLYK